MSPPINPALTKLYNQLIRARKLADVVTDTLQAACDDVREATQEQWDQMGLIAAINLPVSIETQTITMALLEDREMQRLRVESEHPISRAKTRTRARKK